MQILSVRGALPEHRYPQAEITDAFAAVIATPAGSTSGCCAASTPTPGVEHRHLVLPLEEYGELDGLRRRPTTCSSSTPSSSGPGRWWTRSRPPT